MAVNIDIDLKTKNAKSKVEMLRAEIASLEDIFEGDGLSLSDDFDGILDDIDDFTTEVEDLRVELDGLNDDLADTLDDLDGTEIGVNMPDGTTGDSGGENDPPRQNFTIRTADLREATDEAMGDGGTMDFNARQTARRIESRFGLKGGAIDPESLRDMSIREVNAEIAEFVDRSGRNPFGNAGLLKNNRPDGFFLDEDGRFFDDVEADLGESMDRGDHYEKMRRAKEAAKIPTEDPRATKWSRDPFPSPTPGFRMRRDIHHLQKPDKSIKERVQGVRESFSKFGNVLRRLKPSMRQWWQLLAMLLPLLIAAGVQAAGAATAMLGLAGAAGAVIGMGLLGHANDMGDAFGEAKAQLSDLKDELFNTFQGPMQAFAPIQADLFAWLPSQLDGVARAMEGLVVYEDAIFSMFAGLADFAEEFVNIFVRNEDQVSQLALRMGSALGSTLLNGLEWLIETGYENQDMLTSLGSVLVDIGKILYNLSTFVGRVVAALQPLFTMLSWLSGLLNNKLIAFLFTTVTVFALMSYMLVGVAGKVYVLVTAVQSLLSWLAALGAGGVLGGVIPALKLIAANVVALTMDLFGLSFAAATAVTALSALTLGAFAIGAGAAAVGTMGGPGQTGPGPGGNGYAGPGGPSGNGQQVVYHDNRQFEINQHGTDRASSHAVRSEVNDMGAEDTAMNAPSPGDHE